MAIAHSFANPFSAEAERLRKLKREQSAALYRTKKALINQQGAEADATHTIQRLSDSHPNGRLTRADFALAKRAFLRGSLNSDFAKALSALNSQALVDELSISVLRAYFESPRFSKTFLSEKIRALSNQGYLNIEKSSTPFNLRSKLSSVGILTVSNVQREEEEPGRIFLLEDTQQEIGSVSKGNIKKVSDAYLKLILQALRSNSVIKELADLEGIAAKIEGIGQRPPSVEVTVLRDNRPVFDERTAYLKTIDISVTRALAQA